MKKLEAGLALASLTAASQLRVFTKEPAVLHLLTFASIASGEDGLLQ